MDTRRVPTPGDVARAADARCGAPVPGGHCTAPAVAPAPVVEAAAEPYDRHRWEALVLGTSLHRGTRLVALTLSHFAGEAGEIPEGAFQHPDVLGSLTGMSARNVRLSLSQLERHWYVSRPGIATWTRETLRPITLTMPPARARGEIPSTGEVPK